MEVMRVGEGLWRWGAPLAAGGEPAYSTYVETPAATVLIDPVVPAEGDGADRFWRALDRDVHRTAAPVVVLLTSARHRRGEPAIRGRYGAAPADPAAAPPAGVRAVAVAPGERAFLLAAHRALVVGDIARGLPGGLAIRDRRSAAVLRDLAAEVDIVLTAHGPPVLAGGGAALVAAADHPSG